MKNGIVVLVMLVLPWAMACSKKGYEKLQAPTMAMAPTIKAGDVITVDLHAYSSPREVRRWDIVACEIPGVSGGPVFKRIVGLPDETLTCNADGTLIDNRALEIPAELGKLYRTLVAEATGFRGGTWRIPADSFFVVGDNLENSRDSRHFGPIPFANIKGKMVALEEGKNRSLPDK